MAKASDSNALSAEAGNFLSVGSEQQRTGSGHI